MLKIEGKGLTKDSKRNDKKRVKQVNEYLQSDEKEERYEMFSREEGGKSMKLNKKCFKVTKKQIKT